MTKRAALFIAGLFLLAGCSSSNPGSYPIATGPLRADEIAMAGYGSTNLAARVFDVVNQDLNAATNTGLAGAVQPMPADILSNYAAGKFHATGGPYSARFVIKQAGLQVRSVAPPKSSGWFSMDLDSDAKAELTVDLSVMLVATRADGTGATINATTTQGQLTSFGGTPEEHRAVYAQLMTRALQAIDAELSRQLPSYFNSVMAR